MIHVIHGEYFNIKLITICDLFLPFPVELVVELVAISWVLEVAGEVAVDDEGDDGVTRFLEFVLFVVELEFVSV